MSPEFTLNQNKGDVSAHSILLANLLMGCNFEESDDILSWPSLVTKFGQSLAGLENRIFVCVGTRDYGVKRRELWVGKFSRDFKVIRFYDVREGICFDLKGRVGE